MAGTTGIVPFWKQYDRKTVLRFAALAEDLGYDSIWVPEAWAYEQFQLLAEIALATKRIKVATGIANVFSRSPGLLAMSAATLDEISEGRAILGLGTSGKNVVENFHGVTYEKPLTRLRETIGIKRLTAIARSVTSELRSSIRNGRTVVTNGNAAESLLGEAVIRMRATAEVESQTGIKRVINATGVLLHTNLGRAALSAAARDAIVEASRFCSLEYDVATGSRGKRGARVESLLKDLTGAEDALVVNNCAAAALLILTVLASDGETIVSRGELVEIGGDFRVPDVMASSGTRMVEVGTTNRTHLEDYRRAINANTRLIMHVHPSNYRIVGFASSPELAELATLAHERRLLLYEDAGSVDSLFAVNHQQNYQRVWRKSK